MQLQAAGVKMHVKHSQGDWHNSMLQGQTFSDGKQLCYGDVAAFLRDVASGATKGQLTVCVAAAGRLETRE